MNVSLVNTCAIFTDVFFVFVCFRRVRFWNSARDWQFFLSFVSFLNVFCILFFFILIKVIHIFKLNFRLYYFFIPLSRFWSLNSCLLV